MNVLESLKLKFTSGNSVSVTRAQITDKEYIEVCEIVAHAEYSTADIAGLYDVVSSLGGLKKRRYTKFGLS